jgi:hypothetical protein
MNAFWRWWYAYDGTQNHRRKGVTMPTPQIKDEKTYKALRREGASEEKAARIANAAAKTSRSAVGRKGGKAGAYENRTKDDLYAEAKRIGIAGRSNMTKEQLIKALRNH